MQKRIMIVDDDYTLLEELSEALVLNNYNVLAISEVSFAFKQVLLSMPDIILLDLNLKNTHGFQLTNRLKRIPEISHIPIIAISSFYNKEDEKELINNFGFHGFIPKPFYLSDVLMKIEKMLPDCLA